MSGDHQIFHWTSICRTLSLIYPCRAFCLPRSNPFAIFKIRWTCPVSPANFMYSEAYTAIKCTCTDISVKTHSIFIYTFLKGINENGLCLNYLRSWSCSSSLCTLRNIRRIQWRRWWRLPRLTRWPPHSLTPQRSQSTLRASSGPQLQRWSGPGQPTEKINNKLGQFSAERSS